MEPCRPIVDRSVALYCAARGKSAPVDKDAKAVIIGSLLGRFEMGRAGFSPPEKRQLFDIAHRTASNLVEVFAGTAKELVLPVL
jgi:hypothetical protein